METRSNHLLVGGVVLAMIAAVVAFIIWLSQVSGDDQKRYDIFFKQAVDGLAKGSAVSFSGVPVGQVELIALEPNSPEFVRVRIAVREDTPVLQGTTATIQGVGFTGVSQIQLDGATRGAPPITQKGPYGVPVIPTKPGALGQLLNSAPELLERVSTLTERLSEVLDEDNQRSIKGILANTERATGALADRAPEIAATLAEARIAIAQAGRAAAAFEQVAGTSNSLLNEQGRPLLNDLRHTIRAAEGSMQNLDALLGEARPGVQALTKQTIPEIGLLVRDLRETTENLNNITEKVDRQGVGGLIGGEKLPEYKGNRR
ncbi:MAG TPA: MlaD family protein [Allosphingosinicella sp.]|uniref:MlaD family protein n=1 Tax=Allosphingosinicella sp. TaxID=2823234 RepID=UPI002ED7E345